MLRATLRLTIVTAVLGALIVVATTSQWGLWWRLITFTYQANLLAAAYYLWTLARPRADARVGLRGAVVLYVVTALADWLLVGRGANRVAWWQPLAWLVYPAAYLALALLVLNTAGRRAPYFFLDPATVGSVTVALNVGVLAACVLALGYLLLAVHRAAVPLRTESP